MKYTVNTTNKTITLQSSFTYNQYIEIKMKYLGYEINAPNQVCFELN